MHRAAPLWRALSVWLVLPTHFYAVSINKVNSLNVQGVGLPSLYERSTKYLLTFNNPDDNGVEREKLKADLLALNPIYFCMSDEIGLEEHTPHIHVYVVFENARHFKKIKKVFPSAHIDQCFGNHEQCINYVFKEGEWEKKEKGTTNIRESHYEFGERPQNHQGQRNDLVAIMEMIKGGAKPEDIFEVFPGYFTRLGDIQKIISYYKTLDKKDFRYVEVVYICGPTGTGKTSYVMDRYGKDVYRVTDYSHPFDGYNGEKVLVLDEFKGQLNFADMLNYLDGHRHPLPARYANKMPDYDKVYVISNTEFKFLYLEEMHNDSKGYDAWLRRFRSWIYFPETGEPWVSTDYDQYNHGFGISLEDFEELEAKEAILIPIEIEKHRLKKEEKNANRKKVEERVADELREKIEELHKLQNQSYGQEENSEEDTDEEDS